MKQESDQNHTGLGVDRQRKKETPSEKEAGIDSVFRV